MNFGLFLNQTVLKGMAIHHSVTDVNVQDLAQMSLQKEVRSYRYFGDNHWSNYRQPAAHLGRGVAEGAPCTQPSNAENNRTTLVKIRDFTALFAVLHPYKGDRHHRHYTAYRIAYLLVYLHTQQLKMLKIKVTNPADRKLTNADIYIIFPCILNTVHPQ
jgi:hypothetical protein